VGELKKLDRLMTIGADPPPEIPSFLPAKKDKVGGIEGKGGVTGKFERPGG